MRWSRPMEQVCNRKETTWYQNHAFRFRQSVQSESRVKSGDTVPIRGVRSPLTTRLARGCKRWHPPAVGRRYGARSPPYEYRSLQLSLKLTTNSVPLSRIKWEIYFYKEVYFVSLIEVPSLSLIMFLVGSTRSIQHLYRFSILTRYNFLYFCLHTSQWYVLFLSFHLILFALPTHPSFLWFIQILGK